MIEKPLIFRAKRKRTCAARGVELIGSARSGGPQLATGFFTATGTSKRT